MKKKYPWIYPWISIHIHGNPGIYPIEMSRVELCQRCVRACRLSWPSLQFCSQWSRPRSRTWHFTHDAVNLYLYVNSCSPEGATKLSTFSVL